MGIYVAHSSNFDYQVELYDVIRRSSLFEEYDFVFPHEKSLGLFDSRNYLSDSCDLVVAEVSFASTGLGIELGWADSLGVPVVCFYKKGAQVSSSLKALKGVRFVEYATVQELILGIQGAIDRVF